MTGLVLPKPTLIIVVCHVNAVIWIRKMWSFTLQQHPMARRSLHLSICLAYVQISFLFANVFSVIAITSGQRGLTKDRIGRDGFFMKETLVWYARLRQRRCNGNAARQRAAKSRHQRRVTTVTTSPTRARVVQSYSLGSALARPYVPT